MTTCGCCGGLGEVQDLEVRQHGRYAMQWAPCRDCNGSGQVEAPAPDDPAEGMRRVSEFEIDGKTVTAPGFERERFIGFVERARAGFTEIGRQGGSRSGDTRRWRRRH